MQPGKLGSLRWPHNRRPFIPHSRPLACNLTAPKFATGYCTNIHAGTDLEALIANLREFSGPIRQQACPQETLGVGLWVPHQAAEQIASNSGSIERLRDELAALGLRAYTFNGFPYGNFHQKVVKHRVYEPTWWDPRRGQYTWQLAQILDQLLPPGEVGSISTLPLGWGKLDLETQQASADNLLSVARQLADLESKTGRRIVLAIEPEPGCHFDRAAEVVEFFERFIPAEHRRYLTVCHDVCHAAVMNEPQAQVIRQYESHQVTIGKVQISSAIAVDWTQFDQATANRAIEQLSLFAEDRYLHQTGIIDAKGQFTLAEDLPELLRERAASTTFSNDDQAWCIHFHVPIFLDQFGVLRGTQLEIKDCLAALAGLPTTAYVPHLEVETYAWGVLPAEMRAAGLVPSIAAEMRWLDSQLADLQSVP